MQGMVEDYHGPQIPLDMVNKAYKNKNEIIKYC